MRLPLEENGSDCLKLIYDDRLSMEESVEAVIPDAYADATQILDVRGTSLFLGKRVMPDSVAVSAAVEADVIFATEDSDAPKCVSVRLPFEFSSIAKGVGEGSEMTVLLELPKLEAKLLNPRKALIRAETAANVKAYENQVFTLWDAADSEDESGVYTLRGELEFALTTALGEKNFTVSDEYLLPTELGGAQLVSAVTRLAVDEVKAVGARLVFKATAHSDVLFMTHEGAPASSHFETQFSQIIEVGTEAEEAQVDIILSIAGTDFVLLLDANRSVLAANIKVFAQAVLTEKKHASYVADAYSNDYKLELKKERLGLSSETVSGKQRLRLSGELNGANAEEIVCFNCGSVSAHIDGGHIVFSARGSGLGKTDEGCVIPLSAKLTGEENFELEANETLRVRNICCGGARRGERDRIEVDITYEIIICAEEPEEVVSGIETDTDAPISRDSRPSLTVLCSEKQASLWDIAKKYGSSIKAIEEANSLCGEFDERVRPLLVPKV
ncbi:MAG: LysM peptidoglycan-binding domain-containing protein [Oscillospiraceae bacterium]|jgi:hypothetical protein|nr:LysM peptidoglycan-binding domain-containing protein [Oscillospiraceae bacterium]